MAGTRKARVPITEQIRFINECRQSGMTDAEWCRENGIAVSNFYNWVSRCRKATADQIPAANYGHLEVLRCGEAVYEGKKNYYCGNRPASLLCGRMTAFLGTGKDVHPEDRRRAAQRRKSKGKGPALHENR